jgi:glycosyltransferase involved in cell wall biosynthesis
MKSLSQQDKKPSDKKLTVLQVIPNLGAGGAEQTTVDVTSALVKAGHKAIVVSNGGFRTHEIHRAGGISIELPVHSKNPWTIWKNSGRLANLIREYQVDIIHARSRAPAWSALKAARQMGIKFLTTCHAAYKVNDSELKRKYNSVMAKGDVVIANSNFIGHYLVDNYGISPDKVRLIYRGIPLEKFNPAMVSAERMLQLSAEWRVPEVASVILLPGRLSRIKGQTVLIEAMSKMKHKDVYCVLLGDDQGRTEYREELETLIHDLHLESHVRIAEHCDDMVVAYKLASVVVAPSIEPEGFGRVAVEGQAMGIPTIATAIGGAMETIIDGETGFLVPPHNAKALAEKLDEVLDMPAEEKNNLAERASRHARTHFTKDQMTNGTLAVYEELMSNR